MAVRLAKKQSRTMSELFREGLRRLEQEEKRRQHPLNLAELGDVLRAIQQSAKAVGLDKVSGREINAEIRAARKNIPARAKKPAHQRSR